MVAIPPSPAALARTPPPLPPPQQQPNIHPEHFLLLSLPSALVTLHYSANNPFAPSSSSPPTPTPAANGADEPIPRTLEVVSVTYPTPAPVAVAPTPPPLPARPDGKSTPIPTKQEPERDMLLLLRLGPLPPSAQADPSPSSPAPQGAQGAQDIPLLPHSPVYHSPSSSATSQTLHFPTTAPPLSLSLPEPTTAQEAQDLEMLQLLLQDYASLSPYPPNWAPPTTDPALLPSLEPPPEYTHIDDLPPSARGKLLVVDEHSGQVLGEVSHPSLNIQELPSVLQAPEEGPVVITLPQTPPEGEEPQPTQVRPAETEEEFALILRGATVLSRAISSATTALTGGINYASQLYISHVPPSPSGPTHLSPGAHAAVRRVHDMSSTAVSLTAKTTGVVYRFLDRAIDRAGSAANALRPAPDPGAPPPPKTAWREAARLGGKLASRLLGGADMLLTQLETSTQQVVDSASDSVSRSLEHRYGAEVAEASREVGETVRNVGVVWVDARGVGHRALLKRAGVSAVKVGFHVGAGKVVELRDGVPVRGGEKAAGAAGEGTGEKGVGEGEAELGEKAVVLGEKGQEEVGVALRGVEQEAGLFLPRRGGEADPGPSNSGREEPPGYEVAVAGSEKQREREGDRGTVSDEVLERERKLDLEGVLIDLDG